MYVIILQNTIKITIIQLSQVFRENSWSQSIKAISLNRKPLCREKNGDDEKFQAEGYKT